MRLSLYAIALLLVYTFSFTRYLHAQDILSDKRALAAVPVSKESRHHNVFENKWVRILDVHIPPGDTSLFHKHETPSVFIVLSSTKTGSEVVIEPAKPQFTYGNIWFEGFYDKPRIHRVWNNDTTEFHVIDIELPNRDNRKMNSPIASNLGADIHKLLFDEKPVRGYRSYFKARSGLRMRERETPVLVVRLGEGTGGPKGKLNVNGKLLVKKGDYSFTPEGSALEISNPEDSAVELLFLELK